LQTNGAAAVPPVVDPQILIKQKLAASLEAVKFELLDTVISETADFLQFLNQTSTQLSHCNLTCLS